MGVSKWWQMLPVFTKIVEFAFVCFLEIGVSLYSVGWPHIFNPAASDSSAGTLGMCHHAQLILALALMPTVFLLPLPCLAAHIYKLGGNDSFRLSSEHIKEREGLPHSSPHATRRALARSLNKTHM